MGRATNMSIFSCDDNVRNIDIIDHDETLNINIFPGSDCPLQVCLSMMIPTNEIIIYCRRPNIFALEKHDFLTEQNFHLSLQLCLDGALIFFSPYYSCAIVTNLEEQTKSLV